MSRLFLSLLLSLGIASSASALNITLGSASYVFAYADDLAGPYGSNSYAPTHLPDAGTVTASDGANTTNTSYDLANSGLSIGIDQMINDAPAPMTSEVRIFFTPDSDVDYAISGIYSAVDPVGRYIALDALLTDHLTSTALYYFSNVSLGTTNESFTLGVPSGNFLAVETGALTGTLLAGHVYSLYVYAELNPFGNSSTSAARGTGYVSLSFVPEPSTGLLVIAGLLGLAGWRRVRV
jgi:hypothetical protein